MSLERVGGLVGLERQVAEGLDNPIAVNRQGAVIGVDWIVQLAIEGRTFHAQQGDAATQLDFAETAYDEDQPQFALLVPAGVTVIPLSVEVNLQDQAGTDTHVIMSRTNNNIGNGTSTAATITPMRTDAPIDSLCTARSLYTGNATAATGLIEIARIIDPFAAAAGTQQLFGWNIRAAAAIPVLVGPATLQMHVVATTTQPQGFAEYVWAEWPTPNLLRAA